MKHPGTLLFGAFILSLAAPVLFLVAMALGLL